MNLCSFFTWWLRSWLRQAFTRPDAMKEAAFAAFLTPRLSKDDIFADAGTPVRLFQCTCAKLLRNAH